jgi:hypothetical protein
VGARKGRQNGTKKTAKKSEKKNVRASTSVSARGLLFFFFCYVFPPITATAAWNCVEWVCRDAFTVGQR